MHSELISRQEFRIFLFARLLLKSALAEREGVKLALLLPLATLGDNLGLWARHWLELTPVELASVQLDRLGTWH